MCIFCWGEVAKSSGLESVIANEGVVFPHTQQIACEIPCPLLGRLDSIHLISHGVHCYH